MTSARPTPVGGGVSSRSARQARSSPAVGPSTASTGLRRAGRGGARRGRRRCRCGGPGTANSGPPSRHPRPSRPQGRRRLARTCVRVSAGLCRASEHRPDCTGERSPTRGRSASPWSCGVDRGWRGRGRTGLPQPTYEVVDLGEEGVAAGSSPARASDGRRRHSFALGASIPAPCGPPRSPASTGLVMSVPGHVVEAVAREAGLPQGVLVEGGVGGEPPPARTASCLMRGSMTSQVPASAGMAMPAFGASEA
ncbi:hypothetical protein SMICM17S_07573 [Streptomyces microflavus]